MINAVIHRVFFTLGEVAVEKFGDRIAIDNPGGINFPKNKFGIMSRPRNGLLADLLAKTIYMERAGTGISRMRLDAENNKNEIDFYSVMLVFV